MINKNKKMKQEQSICLYDVLKVPNERDKKPPCGSLHLKKTQLNYTTRSHFAFVIKRLCSTP